MPTGPGALDAQGVWQYGEADDADGTASGLLNLGQAATSEQFANVRDRLDTLEIQKDEGYAAFSLSKSQATGGWYLHGDGTANGGTYTELRDRAGWHSPTANPARIVLPAGLYKVTVTGSWSASGTGFRGLEIRKSGAVVLEERITPVSGTATSITLIIPVSILTGDYIDVQSIQDSGGALTFALYLIVDRLP